ncbi:hypothetical protein DUT88_12905 [Shouchella clausii]|nr:hypothetical protein DUT88_12905 [Shouchella clausii]
MTRKTGKFAHLAQEAAAKKEYALRKDNGLGGNGQVPHDMWRRLLPIAMEYNRGYGAAAVIYTYLIANVNGQPDNDRYMSAFVSVDRIARDTGVSRNRVAPLCNVLEAVGLLKTAYDYTGNKREKLYYPQYYSDLTDEEIHVRMAELER